MATLSSASTALVVQPSLKLSDARLRALYDHWHAIGMRNAGLPAFSDFDPMCVPALLANMWIVEVDSDSGRFRMRLAGENINAIYQRSIAPKFFSEVFRPDEMAILVPRYSRALVEPAIVHVTGQVYKAANQHCLGERLGLPMLGSDGATRILLGATVYDYRPTGSPLRPAGDDVEFYPVKAANHRAPEVSGI